MIDIATSFNIEKINRNSFRVVHECLPVEGRAKSIPQAMLNGRKNLLSYLKGLVQQVQGELDREQAYIDSYQFDSRMEDEMADQSNGSLTN